MYGVLCSLVQARYNSQLTLTVSMKNHRLPSSQSSDSISSYAGCAVTLQRVKTTQFGRANQRWTYDTSTGFIVPFSTDTIDNGEFLVF